MKRLVTAAFQVVESTTPTIYVNALMDSVVDLTTLTQSAKRLFGAPGEYISPARFNNALPKDQVVEIAFVGRSNVGKSSLVSALFGDKIDIRISKEPGCTKNVNYFAFIKEKFITCGDMRGHLLYLVDLPGYGFAKATKSEQSKWANTINQYLTMRDFSVLRRTYILIDSRHGVKDADLNMMKTLDTAAIPYQIILTKSDDSSKIQQEKSLNSVFEVIGKRRGSCCLPLVHLVSARTKAGIFPLQQCIAEIVLQKWGNQSNSSLEGAAAAAAEVLPEGMSEAVQDALASNIINNSTL